MHPLPVEPDDILRTDLFRILQELLTNVARHADATHVTATLSAGHAGLRLRIRDNGRGFRAAGTRGLGLLGIRERLRRHGGTLVIENLAPGTAVTAVVPTAA